MAKAIIETPRYRKIITLTHDKCPRNKGGWGNSDLDVLSVERMKPGGVQRINNHLVPIVYKLKCPTCGVTLTMRMDNGELTT